MRVPESLYGGFIRSIRALQPVCAAVFDSANLEEEVLVAAL